MVLPVALPTVEHSIGWGDSIGSTNRYITRSREQPSLLIVIQRKKDVWSTSFVWLVKATAGYPVYNTNGLPTRAPAQPLNQAAFPVASD